MESGTFFTEIINTDMKAYIRYLTENVVNVSSKRYYLCDEQTLPDLHKRYKQKYYGGSGMNTFEFGIVDADYNRIKKDKTNFFLQYNYIYVIDGLRIFDRKNPKHLNLLLKDEKVQKMIKKYPSMKDFKWYIKDKGISAFLPYGTKNKTHITKLIYKYFDADQPYPKRDGGVEVFEKVAIKKAKLIGGNVMRNVDFKKGKMVNFPPDIVEALNWYTDMEGRRLPKDVVEWLSKNTPKKSKTVYRGVRLDKNTNAWKKVLKGKQPKVGQVVRLVRGQPSSWTTSKDIAQGFTKGYEWGVIFEYKLKPSDVIIDFTEISVESKKQFRFFAQNEVILKTGTYNAKIIKIERKGE